MFSELFIRKRNSLTDNGSTWVAVLSLGTCRCAIWLHTIQNRRHTTGMMKCTTEHRQREEIGSLTPCTCLIACLQELPLEKSAEISSLQHQRHKSFDTLQSRFLINLCSCCTRQTSSSTIATEAIQFLFAGTIGVEPRISDWRAVY